ncbi:MAG TPA: DUF2784 domain-containing protein [Woeseiaceae bacterium]|nr:DUF2784 domain-containing protein [Woeseiaceae bacterium]
MLARLAADAVMLVHLGFVLFVVFGGLLVLRFPMAALAHVPAFAWGIWIEATGGICPLTPMENALRRRAGEAGFESGFIEHYLYALIYPPGLTRREQLWLAAAVLLLNGLLYGWWLLRRRRDALNSTH